MPNNVGYIVHRKHRAEAEGLLLGEEEEKEEEEAKMEEEERSCVICVGSTGVTIVK